MGSPRQERDVATTRPYAAAPSLTLVVSAGRPGRFWSAARRDSVLTWIQQSAPLMRLSDWTLEVCFHESSPEGCFANIQFIPDSRHAKLRFGAEFEELDEQEAAHTLTHELLHCHLQPLHELVERSAEVAMSRGAAAVLSVALAQQVETTINNLADAMSPMLPPLKLSAREPEEF